MSTATKTTQWLKPPQAARAEFEAKGVSISAWAAEHKVSRSLVYEILAGRKPCHRGQSHRIAVLLGMKAGELTRSVCAVNAPAYQRPATASGRQATT
ncbi:hypothetical protein VITFI_CDS1523 [Vitreoscilla filiformis]|uniref:DNA-binding protein n=1 Tax=Vitreoscilla filiformis TaxID=63 RepID=A0A221KAN9_VITFI|nr:DNA-binding protein [Vitreoscilla filiformis]ASM75900.1 hypothetical protein VITFI_CDS0121 [Vitreoscilla filiformis]ASM76426.1 hypothetical protein VITFI_CDS0647 [Vitreoscilla filiformis]ASM76850.1 hypothetical protein VITFI_CDS1072 [Vitreoscilla filiformis]ASM77301.1 hypothetical protein VITFI_CDS1523 [Vitreoscilla filiformis]